MIKGFLNKAKKYVSIILTFFIVCVFIVYFIKNYQDFVSVLSVGLGFIILLFILQVLSTIVSALYYQLLFHPLNNKVKFKDGLLAAGITSVGNYFLPFQGGIGLRAVYFKKNFQISYTKFISTLSGIFILTFLLTSIGSIISLLIINNKNNIYSIPLYLFFFGLLTLTLYMIFFKLPKLKFKFLDFFFSKINSIEEGWDEIKKDKANLAKLVFIAFVQILLSAVITYIEFHLIGISLSPEILFLYIGLSSISIFINLTPAGIGIKEGIFLIFSSVLSLTSGDILKVAVIDRTILFLFVFILFIFLRLFSPKLFKLSTSEAKVNNLY